MQNKESTARPKQNMFTTTKDFSGGCQARLAAAVKKWLWASVLGLLAFANSALSANWYVRPASQGSANGTSWANAWSVANLNATWASVQPGDTIWLAGGSYSGGISFNKSGSAGNYIYVKRATGGDAAATGATGWSAAFDSQVIFGPSGSVPLYWSSASGAGSYVYVDGRTTNGISCRYDNSANAFLGAAAWSGGGQNNIVLTNLDLAGPGGATPFFYNGDNAPVNLRSSAPVSYITISHCNVHGGPNLIRSNPNGGNHHITIEYCRFYDNASSNTDVHANLIYNEQGYDWTIRHNDFSGWQVEGIILWNVGSGIYHIYGNVFHDPIPGVASGFWPGSNAAGNDPQGTVYLYNNTFVGVNITTAQSRSWQFGSGSIARNNVYWNSGWAGNSMIANSDYNFSSGSTPGANSISSGSNPFVNEAANDFRIVGTVGAKYPKDKGVALGSPYNIGPSSGARVTDGAWDMGAYENGAASASLTVSAGPDLSAMLPNNSVTLAGSVFNPTSGVPSISWTAVSGPGTVSFGNSASATTTATFSTAGTHTLRLTATVSAVTVSDDVVVVVNAAPPELGLNFSATNTTVTAPFTITGNYISQTVDTDISSGGRAAYLFAITNAGDYMIAADVNAPNPGANSVFLNIDAEPADPVMIWDIPITAGIVNQTVSWRGNGTDTANQFSPKIFALSLGQHQLIVRGREPGVQMARFYILKVPIPPSNLVISLNP